MRRQNALRRPSRRSSLAAARDSHSGIGSTGSACAAPIAVYGATLTASIYDGATSQHRDRHRLASDTGMPGSGGSMRIDVIGAIGRPPPTPLRCEGLDGLIGLLRLPILVHRVVQVLQRLTVLREVAALLRLLHGIQRGLNLL